MSDEAAPPGESRPAPGDTLGAWWRQGVRSAVLMAPDWSRLRASPARLVALLLVPYGLGIVIERLGIPGSATAFWPAVTAGWLPAVVGAWLCWALVPVGGAEADAVRAPSAVALYSLMVAQMLPLVLVSGLIWAPLVRSGWAAAAGPGSWIVWTLLMAWVGIAQATLLWRGSPAPAAAKALASVLLIGLMVFNDSNQTVRFWYADEPDASEAGPARLKLTQALLESQPRLLEQRLGALLPPEPGGINVYAITFAPYAEEDVFRRESQLVATVMQQRFGAQGRTIQLVNHRDTAHEWPWATPLNLQRAIQRVAQTMDRERDLLFIHLTSHGASSGVLSASFWPLEIESVTPPALRAWLDEAGIRYRVISVSACHSGSWIAPLAEPGSLVMTASDIEHTSYGCGRKSELTYFGRAMYDEQLRQTWSFESAHAQARLVIDQREREAGKSDGFSNPQIAVGATIRDQLARLEAQLRHAAAH